MCILSPGAALTSITAPLSSSNGFVISLQVISTPAISSPINFAAFIAISALCGWTTSVQSLAVPPVLRFPLKRSITFLLGSGMLSSLYPLLANTCLDISSILIVVRGFSWSAPLKGLRFSMSTSCLMVLIPLPITNGAFRSAAATTFPPTTRSL